MSDQEPLPEASTDAELAVGRSSRHGVLRNAIAVGLATGAYGIAFGAAGAAAGLSTAQTCALSLLVFTGASQFALVGVLGAGGAPLAGVASALLLGARNTLYGLRLAEVLRRPGERFWSPRRLGQAQLVIDESTAMAVAQPTPALTRLGFSATGLAVFVFWNLATLFGAAGAEILGDPALFGLDAAVPAAFLALLAPRLRTGRVEVRVAAAGAVIALIATPFLPPGVPVLLAAAGVLVALRPIRMAGTPGDPEDPESKLKGSESKLKGSAGSADGADIQVAGA
jgi:predicted branched-subunit amino acid permease